MYSKRFDMPGSFGPSQMPEVSTATGWSARVSFDTEAGAISDLLPPFYRLPASPRVTVSYSRLSGLDWLAGGGYSLLAVHIDAVFRGEVDDVSGPFCLVVWEDDCTSISAGREYLGVPKLYGDLPAACVGEASFDVNCSEYGSELVRMEFEDMVEASDETVNRVNAASERYHWLGWKHIPGLDGAPDADYPTQLTQGAVYDRVWRGRAQVRFCEPTFEQAPVSSRIVRRLAAIPQLRVGAAVASHATSLTLDRAATKRLR